MHAATPAVRDAAACASLPLKCPSPVTLEAMHIARQCGVLTDLEVGSAGDGRDPSRRVSGALVGSVLRYDDEKENIDPVTGVHARLASGVAAGTNARGASRLSSNRAIATLPRALVFKIRTDARSTSPLTRAGASDPRSFPDAAPGATGAPTRQPLADITPSFVNMVRHARFSRASRRRENVHPPTRASARTNNVTFPARL